MKKITKRDMYEAIKGLADSGALHMQDFNDGINDAAVAEFCEKEIALLDKKAAKAKETAAKKKADGDELTDAVRAVLSPDEFQSIADVAAQIEGEDVTVSKVTYRLTQLVKNGEAEKQEISVAGGEGQKSRKIMAYRLIAQ